LRGLLFYFSKFVLNDIDVLIESWYGFYFA
jgi:hypothetical protein